MGVILLNFRLTRRRSTLLNMVIKTEVPPPQTEGKKNPPFPMTQAFIINVLAHPEKYKGPTGDAILQAVDEKLKINKQEKKST